MSLHMRWISLDHATEGTQEVTLDLSLPASQTRVENNSDLNTPGSPRGLLLEGDLATLFLPLLPVVPKSWEGSGKPQLPVSKVYKTQVRNRERYQDKSSKRLLLYLQEKKHQFSVIFSLPFPQTPKSTCTQPFPVLVWQERTLWSQMSPHSATTSDTFPERVKGVQGRGSTGAGTDCWFQQTDWPLL